MRTRLAPEFRPYIGLISFIGSPNELTLWNDRGRPRGMRQRFSHSLYLTRGQEWVRFYCYWFSTSMTRLRSRLTYAGFVRRSYG